MYATRVLAHYFLFLFFGFHISTYTEVVLKIRGKPTVQRSFVHRLRLVLTTWTLTWLRIQKLWFLELTVDYYCLGLAVHHTSQCYVVLTNERMFCKVVYGTLFSK